MNTDIQPPQPAAAPPQDVQPPTEAPVAEPPQLEEKAQPEAAPKKEQAKPAAPIKPKQPGNGVGAAIAATVIIVLGLAALATYAYLKTR